MAVKVKAFLNMAVKNLFFVLLVSFFFMTTNAVLSTTYYSSNCPNLTSIVRDATSSIIAQDPTLAPSLLRLFFHDCFVRGADASVLLVSNSTNVAEMDAPINSNLRGFLQINQIKAAVQAACPNTVSCADILAMAARVAVVQMGGKSWDLPLGRLDGFVSLASEVSSNLPHASFNITQLISSFAAKNLTVEDLVVLSGGHSFGRGHCSGILRRLYNTTTGSPIDDPTLNQTYAQELREVCPFNSSSNMFFNLDRITPNRVDNAYFDDVYKNASAFVSDGALLNNAVTLAYVESHTDRDANKIFLRDFANAMRKLSDIVNSSAPGEIRLNCSLINT